jgi:hypothetical protein
MIPSTAMAGFTLPPRSGGEGSARRFVSGQDK